MAVDTRADTRKVVDIYTDGACSGNPGPGGWGALLRFGEIERELSGADADTTNNRMELMAAIQALESLNQSCIVHLTTDSQYVRQGITEWLPKWIANQWRTAAKQPVKNQDLWERLQRAAGRHQVHWHWVKGHSDHPENERVDELARNAIIELRQRQ